MAGAELIMFTHGAMRSENKFTAGPPAYCEATLRFVPALGRSPCGAEQGFRS